MERAGSVVIGLIIGVLILFDLLLWAAFTRFIAENYGPKLHPRDHCHDRFENQEVIMEKWK